MKNQVLKSIGLIYEKSKDSELNDTLFETLDKEMTLLSEYFKTTKNQAFILGLVFSLCYTERHVDTNDLINHMKCNPIKLLELNDDFIFLFNLGFFEKLKLTTDFFDTTGKFNFVINSEISEAILKNVPIPNLHEKPELVDVYEVLETIVLLGTNRFENDSNTKEFLFKTNKIIDDYKKISLINMISNLDLNPEDQFLFIFLIWKTLTGYGSIDLSRTVDIIFDKPTAKIKYMQKMVTVENKLLNSNLVEFEESSFLNEIELKLTEHSVQLLKENELVLFTKKQKKDNIFFPSEIPAQELFFCENEMKQLFLFKEMLSESKFLETQNRLKEKKLPKGITALLHGFPGTGKTEIVKQIARETNRILMKVDISQSKSMWFGESEKIIKKVFTDYKILLKESELTPILLFNEADAIISRRKDVKNSSVAQTENAIQNIILEEMENFEGILIATTNLVEHLDIAFERRFLFKIKFSKPTPSIRVKIWRTKMPDLEMDDSLLLSENFNFSGGQINNIVRKKEIYEIKIGRAHV